jgi:hypothetical protein
MTRRTTAASRSFIGSAVPGIMGAAAATYFVLVCWHTQDPVWGGLDPFARVGTAAVAIFAAMIAESIVRWQLRLVSHGVVAEAIVDEIHVPILRPRGHTNATVFYHFVTEDHRNINARLSVPRGDAPMWTRRHFNVIYDPSKPTRHAHDERLWAVQWDIAEPQEQRS